MIVPHATGLRKSNAERVPRKFAPLRVIPVAEPQLRRREPPPRIRVQRASIYRNVSFGASGAWYTDQLAVS
jgi:hypothetical protein